MVKITAPTRAASLAALLCAVSVLGLSQPAHSATRARVDIGRELDSLRAKYPKLKAPEAARAWAAMAWRFMTLKAHSASIGNERFADVVAALPPPAAWPSLPGAIKAAPPARLKSLEGQCLLSLARLLNGDRAGVRTAIPQLEKALARPLSGVDEDVSSYGNDDALDTLGNLTLSLAESPAQVMQGVEMKLRAAVEIQSDGGALKLPDLVTLVGRQQAAAVLRRALVTRPMVEIESGDATKTMARQMAMEMLPKLRTPQWALAQSLDGYNLYQALNRRFAVKSGADAYQYDYERRSARAFYLLSLMVRGKSADALAMAERMQYQIFSDGMGWEAQQAIGAAGQNPVLFQFLHQMLVRRPDLPYWDTYIELGAKVGPTKAVQQNLQKALARPKLTPRLQSELRNYLAAALLAGDKVEEAITVLRACIATPRPAPAAPKKDDPSSGGLTFNDNIDGQRWEAALKLMQLGKTLNRWPLAAEGIAAVRGYVHDEAYDSNEYRIGQVAEQGAELGQNQFAIDVLQAALSRLGASKTRIDQSSTNQLLKTLGTIYSRMGRDSDLLILLRTHPQWGVADVTDMLDMAGCGNSALPLATAKALKKTGDAETALRLVRTILRNSANNDPAMQLLVDLQGKAAIPFLDDLMARDRFEERPLIWKAELLRQAGRYAEAETCARAAIAIDPSDGDSPGGDRMRGYAVLGRIRQARGAAADAKFMESVVRAIRMSERADVLNGAGLLQRSIQLYEDSLKQFADAYCIQSRLAIQLAQQGKFDAAAAHYRKAYELMPSSFGRMESHCFGCERVFEGKRAESIAAQVFAQLVKKTPLKPQVHYLLGYLRDEQQRYAEALPHYRRAVQLDPDYINAWKQLQGIDQHMTLPQADIQAAAFAMLRLDPTQRHGNAQMKRVKDVRGLWTAVENAHRRAGSSRVYPLFPLPASVAEAKRRAAAAKASKSEEWRYSYTDVPIIGSGEELQPPARVVSRQQSVAALCHVIDWHVSGDFTGQD